MQVDEEQAHLSMATWWTSELHDLMSGFDFLGVEKVKSNSKWNMMHPSSSFVKSTRVLWLRTDNP